MDSYLIYMLCDGTNRFVFSVKLFTTMLWFFFFFFFSSRRRHTRWTGDWSSDVCSSDLNARASVFMLNRDLDGEREVVIEWQDTTPARVLACETLTGPDLKAVNTFDAPRSEERRVGKECRARWRTEQ